MSDLDGLEVIWEMNAPDRLVHFAVKYLDCQEVFIIEASLIDDDEPLDFGVSLPVMRALCDALAAKLAALALQAEAEDAELPALQGKAVQEAKE